MKASDTPADVRDARSWFPAASTRAYFNSAATGLASHALIDAYRGCVDRWGSEGFDYVAAEAAGESCRESVAALMGADRAAVALIASVSAAAGLVAAQLPPTEVPANVVIGEREYSSNHFPWRLLEHKGYEVRQVPFRDGGLDPDDVALRVDATTCLVAFSAVQTATGHRSDIAALADIAQRVGALVFVDGSQLIGAGPIADELDGIDVLATADHKYLMHAGRGLGYCYLSARAQDRFTPVNAGWKAGRVPFDSFFGPTMDLSPTASRFDSSISWVAAIGNQAALTVFARLGADAVYRRNRELADQLRAALTEVGWVAADLPDKNRSTIVSIPVPHGDASDVVRRLADRRVVASARDGNVRFSVHVYNDENDISQLVDVLRSL